MLGRSASQKTSFPKAERAGDLWGCRGAKLLALYLWLLPLERGDARGELSRGVCRGSLCCWLPHPSPGTVAAISLLIFLFLFTRSSWELPDLREGRVKAISDSDGVSYPWYGNTTETVTLVGPTNKISRFSVSMNDNFYPSVTWAVPVSNSNVPLLTRIKRDQSFTTWLVAMNTTTKEKIILQTIKWRMRVDIEVDPMQLLGQRARLVGRTQQEQPRILSRMEPIPPNALVKPNANDAQVLMWRPKRGQPIVVIPPK
uniref:Uncharacterized protein n=1 Tax=Ficedula albicollis TaxID=59894 RepID=U3JMF4_FICAL